MNPNFYEIFDQLQRVFFVSLFKFRNQFLDPVSKILFPKEYKRNFNTCKSVLFCYCTIFPTSLGLKQSHYIRSRVGNHFYGTEYEIWADFWLVGNTDKKNQAIFFFQFLQCPLLTFRKELYILRMSDDLSELHYESLKQSWLQRLSRLLCIYCAAQLEFAFELPPPAQFCLRKLGGPFIQFLNKITNLIKFLQRKLDMISSYVFATKVHFFDMHLS